LFGSALCWGTCATNPNKLGIPHVHVLRQAAWLSLAAERAQLEEVGRGVAVAVGAGVGVIVAVAAGVALGLTVGVG